MKRREFLAATPLMAAGAAVIAKKVAEHVQEELVSEFNIGMENGNILHLNGDSTASFEPKAEFYERKAKELEEREALILAGGWPYV